MKLLIIQFFQPHITSSLLRHNILSTLNLCFGLRIRGQLSSHIKEQLTLDFHMF